MVTVDRHGSLAWPGAACASRQRASTATRERRNGTPSPSDATNFGGDTSKVKRESSATTLRSTPTTLMRSISNVRALPTSSGGAGPRSGALFCTVSRAPSLGVVALITPRYTLSVPARSIPGISAEISMRAHRSSPASSVAPNRACPRRTPGTTRTESVLDWPGSRRSGMPETRVQPRQSSTTLSSSIASLAWLVIRTAMFHASEPTGLHTPRSRLKTNGGGVSSIPLARSLMRCAAEAACAAIINAAIYEVRHTEMRKLCSETRQASRNDCKRAVRLVNILNDITRGYMSQLFLCFAAGNGLNWRIESPPHGYSHEVEQLMFATVPRR